MQECTERYGKPVSVQNGLTSFRKGGYVIDVRFFEDRAEYIYVAAAEKNHNYTARLTEREIDTLLRANGGNLQWKETRINDTRTWDTSGWEMHAFYVEAAHALVIFTAASGERKTKAERPELIRSLEGF